MSGITDCKKVEVKLELDENGRWSCLIDGNGISACSGGTADNCLSAIENIMAVMMGDLP